MQSSLEMDNNTANPWVMGNHLSLNGCGGTAGEVYISSGAVSVQTFTGQRQSENERQWKAERTRKESRLSSRLSVQPSTEKSQVQGKQKWESTTVLKIESSTSSSLTHPK